MLLSLFSPVRDILGFTRAKKGSRAEGLQRRAGQPSVPDVRCMRRPTSSDLLCGKRNGHSKPRPVAVSQHLQTCAVPVLAGSEAAEPKLIATPSIEDHCYRMPTGSRADIVSGSFESRDWR